MLLRRPAANAHSNLYLSLHSSQIAIYLDDDDHYQYDNVIVLI